MGPKREIAALVGGVGGGGGGDCNTLTLGVLVTQLLVGVGLTKRNTSFKLTIAWRNWLGNGR
jgi:hypothetical protein